MKLTNQQKEEIKRVLDIHWDSYLKADLKKWASFLPNDYRNIGTTHEEIWNSKKEIVDYTRKVADQLKGMAELRNKVQQVISYHPHVMVHEFGDMYIKTENTWIFYAKLRLSSLLEKSAGGWKILHQHASYPDAKANAGETFAFHKISKENLELKEAVKRRTIEIENKNLELQIQASLEKVRAQALGMHKPADVLTVCEVLFKELIHLGFGHLRNAVIHTFHDEKNYYNDHDYSDFTGGAITVIPYSDQPLLKRFLEEIRKSENAFFKLIVTGNELKDWKKFRKQTGQMDDPRLSKTRSLFYYVYSVGNASIGISTFKAITEDQLQVLKRFRNVFDFAYRRYVEVTNAEAQTREAQIELALERVRARTMAMQKSEELAETSFVLFQQFRDLGEPSVQISIGIFNEDENIMELYSTLYGSQWKESKSLDLDEPIVIKKIHTAWKDQKKSLVIDISGKDLQKYNAFRKKLSNIDYKEDRWVVHIAFFSKGVLTLSVTEPQPNETIQLLERFAQVFGQTYTRFLDLKKAEAQAKEAQIEAALEKVRSRSLAMRKADELGEVVTVVVQKLKELNVPVDDGVAIVTHINGSKDQIEWLENPGFSSAIKFYQPYFEHPVLADYWKAKNQELDFINPSYTAEENKSFLNHIFQFTDYKNTPQEIKEYCLAAKSYSYSAAFQTNSSIFINDYSGRSLSIEQIDIVKRFSKVFEQAYVRFLDLQKAEAQAREAQIEAALERVRTTAMAMRRDDDLVMICEALYKELKQLGLENIRNAQAGIIDEEKKIYKEYSYSHYRSSSVGHITKYAEDSLSNELVGEMQKSKDAFFKKQLSGEEFENWRNWRIQAKLSDDPLLETASSIWFYMYSVGSGGIGISTFDAITEDQQQLLKRFRNVFELSYQRFLDLRQAEAQAKEAQIEAALERVRSRTLAMQKSDELPETAAILFKQLILLGIEPSRLYINIIKDDNGDSEFWITDEDGNKVSSAFESNMKDNQSFKKMFEGWQEKKKSLIIDMQGKELTAYFQYLANLHVPFKYGEAQKRRLQYIAYFNKGFIGMASPDEQPEETIHLLERFAAVFNLTFTRFNDLKVAEAHAIKAREDLIKLQTEKKRAETALGELRVTQNQLIQSEKMASLGELTAGIAHEIQNPLNFVNNFSEVSNELIDEMMEAVARGNYEEVKVIADDVRQNLEKINHHGKRADGIVKGMLHHSRNSNAVKEPTDINKLVDEYLRLAFHGLRAKDKTFNAALKTDYDKTIGNISVIPQDIGRVMLNLINNAFYAAIMPAGGTGFTDSDYKHEPTVWVSTKKTGDKVLISVKDNGPGIQQKTLDKIFQPFFTTKPAGQGTGLGLSLSYDIVKAHGGELKVETKEGEGAEFIIQLSFV